MSVLFALRLLIHEHNNSRQRDQARAACISSSVSKRTKPPGVQCCLILVICQKLGVFLFVF